MHTKLSFPTLLLLISFASVNAVLFTPALPSIIAFFNINEAVGQQTLTGFLVGYALGQLFYGPIMKRFGARLALYLGINIQIVSSLICVFAGQVDQYWILVAARFFLALGSGVGLKMTFTLVNECYAPQVASQKISYLMLAFAVAPGLGVAIGGALNSQYGWQSCFYAGAIYGLMLLVLVWRLPLPATTLDTQALKLKQLLGAYALQFCNRQVVTGGVLMGASTAFVYAFAAAAPFIAMNLYGMASAAYGMANILPSVGLIAGSLVGGQFAVKYPLKSIMTAGVLISVVGTFLMYSAILLELSVVWAIFLPMAVIYFGLCFIMANASTMAMTHVTDKANGSAVMNFMNMGIATLVVLSLSLFQLHAWVLPTVYLTLCAVMLILLKY